MDFQKIREQLGVSNDKPLTPEEKRRRAKYIVYPFFCLLCMGFLLLVFSPSEKEKAEMEKGRGFNVEMPSPEDSEMEGNKVSAYEQEALAKKEKWRRGTFQEMSELLNKDGQDTAGLTAGKANMELPPEPEKWKAPGSIRSSAEAYRNMNRYNGKEPDASSTTNAPNSRKERTAVRPVKRVQNRMVSSLAQPAGNEDIASGYAGERNTGFHTPVGKMPSSGRNTIAACVHGTQTVSDGQALRIRLLEPMVGGTRVEGERMGILIETVEYRGTLFPVELEVYDADGQQGILVPNSMEYDAAREIAAGMGTSIGSSINISTDAGAQIASDVGKGVIRGVSQYVGKKMRTVKITLKAGHRLLLHSPEK